MGQYGFKDNLIDSKISEIRNVYKSLKDKNISKQDQNNLSHSNPYVKLSLLTDEDRNDGWQDNHRHQQQQQSQQTSVCRKTQNPVWDERFRFHLSLKEAQRVTLQLTVRDFDKYSRHCCIGQAIMELGEVNLLKGGHFWRALSSAEVGSIIC